MINSDAGSQLTPVAMDAANVGYSREQMATVLEEVKSGLTQLQFNPELDHQTETGQLETPQQQAEQAYLDFYQLSLTSDLKSVKHYLGCFQAEGFQLVCHYWVPPSSVDKPVKGTYFVLHGYFDHVALYEHLIHYLLRQNYAVVAFDLPGHGLSSGARASINSFDQYENSFEVLLNKCQQHLPKPWHAAGQSTGGAILLKYLMSATFYHTDNVLDDVVLLAPLVIPKGWHKSKTIYKLCHRFLKKIPRTFIPNSADKVFNSFIEKSDPLQHRDIPLKWIGAMKRWAEEFSAFPQCHAPIKIIQGNQDITVEWTYNLKVIQEKFPNSTVHIIDAAQHHMVNEIPAIREDIFKKFSN